MIVHFLGREKHPNGKIVATLALEMAPEEWDRFASDMQGAYDDNDRPNVAKVIRIMRQMFDRAENEIGAGQIQVPIEKVSQKEFHRLIRRANERLGKR